MMVLRLIVSAPAAAQTGNFTGTDSPDTIADAGEPGSEPFDRQFFNIKTVLINRYKSVESFDFLFVSHNG